MRNPFLDMSIRCGLSKDVLCCMLGLTAKKFDILAQAQAICDERLTQRMQQVGLISSAREYSFNQLEAYMMASSSQSPHRLIL